MNVISLIKKNIIKHRCFLRKFNIGLSILVIVVSICETLDDVPTMLHHSGAPKLNVSFLFLVTSPHQAGVNDQL